VRVATTAAIAVLLLVGVWDRLAFGQTPTTEVEARAGRALGSTETSAPPRDGGDRGGRLARGLLLFLALGLLPAALRSRRG
jgi:hypothetical protein